MSEQTSEFDRLPPHSIEAEMCVLASMMLDQACVMDVAGIVQTADAFFQADHQVIFKALAALDSDGRSIDPIVLRTRLADQGILEHVGGTAYLAQIVNTVPSAAHATEYARIVREKHRLRQVIQAAGESLRDAYRPTDDAAEVVERFAGRAMDVCESVSRTAAVHLSEPADDLTEIIEGRKSRKPAIPTGWKDLDDLLDGGLRGGQLIVIGARPGMGKSAFSLGMGTEMAKAGVPVAVYSLEMERDEMMERIASWLSEIPFRHIRRGCFDTPMERDRVSAAIDLAKRLPLWIDDSSHMSITDITLRTRTLRRKEHIGVMIIDYLQLMDIELMRGQLLTQAIGVVTRGLKLLAKQLDIPIVLLSQLSRPEKETVRKPRMSDLRESGNIEQDADVVILLHREDYYHKEQGYTPTNHVEAIVEKQRNGPTDSIPLQWDGRTMKMRSAVEIMPLFD